MSTNTEPVIIAGATFAISVGAASYAAVLLRVAGSVIWSDLIHSNSHRTLNNSLFLICIESPVIAAITVLLAMSMSVLAAGVLAGLAAKMFRRIPIWVLPAIATICVLSLNIQVDLLHPFLDVSAEYGQSSSQRPELWISVVKQALLGSLYLPPLMYAWMKTKALTASLPVSPG